MTGTKGRPGGKREGAGRPTLAQEFVKLKQEIEQAEAFGTEQEFKDSLSKMIAIQARIVIRLEEAQAIVEELEPLRWSADFRLMGAWVKKYGR